MYTEIHPIKDIVRYQKQGLARGICSVCSSNRYVIEAAIEKAAMENTYVLIEATSNQVNQYGGYTGMKPADFRDFVFSIAYKQKFPTDRIILGGDHLGPFVWKNEASKIAMAKAEELIKQYVLSGFSKIHIDTSMRLGGDPEGKCLETSLIAERGAVLCAVAREAFNELKKFDCTAVAPVYVIGSEVPIPGGSQQPGEELKVTSVRGLENTIEEFRDAFARHGLIEEWENVVAVVVQPGIEFGDETIHEYNREDAKELSKFIKKYPNLVFEGHSTDYQTAGSLKQMVEDGIAILKVGPALTFAVREAMFLLQIIENELFASNPEVRLSKFMETLDEAMIKDPVHWNKYYHGKEGKIRFKRKYSLSDRCRYYLTAPEVSSSIDILISNLRRENIPVTLLSQFFPIQYNKIRNGVLKNEPEEIIKDKVVNVLEDYYYATAN